MELAELVFDRAEHLDDGLRIERRAVGRDAPKGQPSGDQGLVEPPEEPEDVGFGRVVVEDLVQEPLEMAVIDDRQDAVRPVVEFVGGDGAGEVGQGGVEVLSGDGWLPPFFPPASTQFWTVAKGTKTRWSRHPGRASLPWLDRRRHEAARYGRPSSTTRRTARATTRCV